MRRIHPLGLNLLQGQTDTIRSHPLTACVPTSTVRSIIPGASVITEGCVQQLDAMGVKTELREHGFSLLYVSFPSADLSLRAGQECVLCEAHFGQYQR